MRYRKFGRTGFDVSEIGYGLWGVSGWSGSDDAESLQAMQLAVDAGCNFFDTAWAYGDGKSDAMLGRILAMPEIKEKLAAQGIDVAFVGPDAFAAVLRTDMAKYAKVIKTADIRMDN